MVESSVVKIMLVGACVGSEKIKRNRSCSVPGLWQALTSQSSYSMHARWPDSIRIYLSSKRLSFHRQFQQTSAMVGYGRVW